MSDPSLNQPDLRLTRDQLAEVVGDNPQATRTFERQLQYVNELYRKPSIALGNTAGQNLDPLGVETATVFDSTVYANNMELDTIDPSIVRFLQAGRYRVTFQANVVATPNTTPITQRIIFWFKFNGVALPEGIIEDFWIPTGAPVISLSKGVNLAAYITDVVPNDELQVFSYRQGLAGCLLYFSSPGVTPGSAANLFVERVY